MLTVILGMCIALDVAREVCFKMSARIAAFTAPVSTPHQTIFSIKPAAMWGGFGVLLWGIEILAYAKALSILPLSVAFPILSLTYAATPLAGRLLLGERITVQRWAGIGFVTVGVMAIGLSGTS